MNAPLHTHRQQRMFGNFVTMQHCLGPCRRHQPLLTHVVVGTVPPIYIGGHNSPYLPLCGHSTPVYIFVGIVFLIYIVGTVALIYIFTGMKAS